MSATFKTQGIESVITNTENLLDDPIIEQMRDFVPPAIEAKKKQMIGSSEKDRNPVAKADSRESDDEGFLGELKFKIGMENFVSGTNKNIKLPFSFNWREFTFGGSLPYVYSKKMNYALKSAESNGMGDMSLDFGYGSSLAGIDYGLNIFLKLPTGDDTNMESGYLVPLGTGTTDIVLAASAAKFLEISSFGGSIMYKINGSSDKIAEIEHTENPDGVESTTDMEKINYTITNGNFLMLDGYYDYYSSFGVTFTGNLAFTFTGEGGTDKEHVYSWTEETEKLTDISNKQDMFLMDFTPSASYSYWILDFNAGLKIPLYTKRNDDNLEDDRGMAFFFKVDYNIF